MDEFRLLNNVGLFEEWGYTRKQAELYASVIFSQNNAGSAERVIQNINELTGSWINGDTQSGGTAYVKTTQETWEFRDDLAYEHKAVAR